MIPTSIAVQSTGMHNVYGSLFDYAAPPPDAIDAPPGTILTSATVPPTVSIDPTSWTITATAMFVGVYQPQTTANDSLHCHLTAASADTLPAPPS